MSNCGEIQVQKRRKISTAHQQTLTYGVSSRQIYSEVEAEKELDAEKNRNNPKDNESVSEAEEIDPTNDEEKLKALLEDWNVPSFYPILRSNEIDYKNLQSLQDPLYTELIKNGEESLGKLLTFRDCHIKWKNSMGSQYHQAPSQDENINVNVVLKKGGEIAAKITGYFKAAGYLTDDLRVDLVDLILLQKEYLSREMMIDIADQICKVFPGEEKTTYYEVIGSKVTGLLYDRYNKLRRKNKSGIAKASKAPVANDADLLSDDMQLSIDYVNNEKNFNGPMQELFEHWDITYPYRKTRSYTAEDALNEFPVLKTPDGFVMILSDFLTEYKEDVANSLKSKWEDFIFSNVNVIIRGIKNPKARKQLQGAQSESNFNIRDRKILMALHYVSYLTPTRTATKKKTWTPSIPSSEDAFLVIVKKKQGVVDAMKKRKILFDSWDIACHPIIFECNDSEEPKYFIGLADTIYDCDTLIQALDAAFKIFVILKVPFPPECAKVWLFLNEVFFKIDLEQKASYQILSNLSSYRL